MESEHTSGSARGDISSLGMRVLAPEFCHEHLLRIASRSLGFNPERDFQTWRQEVDAKLCELIGVLLDRGALVLRLHVSRIHRLDRPLRRQLHPSFLRCFKMGDLECLIASHPLVLVADRRDGIFPIKGVKETFDTIQQISEATGASE